MLHLHDIRETPVYMEAVEEGEKIGIKKERDLTIRKMVTKNITAEQIGDILDIGVEEVREVLEKAEQS
jgi:predicted transposase YdaD